MLGPKVGVNGYISDDGRHAVCVDGCVSEGDVTGIESDCSADLHKGVGSDGLLGGWVIDDIVCVNIVGAAQWTRRGKGQRRT